MMPRRLLGTRGWAQVAAAVVALGVGVSAAQAQLPNPVYPDDSPVARDTLARIGEFIASGNQSEVVRELQRVLDEHGDKVVGIRGESDLFTSVRQRALDILLSHPEILERYRAAENPRAQQMLDNPWQVERTRLLTTAGFEAALRVAQLRLESAGFEAARIVLEQLENHPDRTRGSAQARDAAAMLAQVARYLNRPEVWAQAKRWAREAGVPEPKETNGSLPPLLAQPLASFSTVSPPVEVDGLPAKPLWSVPITPEEIPGAEANLAALADDPTSIQGRQWVLPTVVGDTVYVNDGTFVTARDRFTLQPRWSVRPTSDFASDNPFQARMAMSLVEDTSTVTLSGRLLVATMGAAQNSDREGDPGTYGIDALTGQILWSALLPLLDPQLEGATVRGAAMVDGDTVILPARKNAQGRRMITYYLVGISAADGKLRWVRPIGSAGALIWGLRSDQRHSGAVLHQGIVYCVDNIGVVAAVEGSSGRPLWMRRIPVTGTMPGMGGELIMPWQTSPPFVHGQSLFLLAPDRSGLMQLESGTGRIQARRTSSSLGAPLYLLKIGERFAAVNRETLIIGPLENVSNATVHRAPPPGIRGRCVVAGDTVVVPTNEGVAIIDPAEPTRIAGAVKLERLGNVLPLESQLLAIDGQNIHSYLTWTVAHELLDQRMRENPGDPEPAITYAELAYRAGHHHRIASAADRALLAIEQVPGIESARMSRRRLFTVLKEMVDWTQQAWDVPPESAIAGPPKPAPRIPPRTDRLARQSTPERPRLNLEDMNAIVLRMGRAAQDAEDQLSHLIAVGRLREAENKPALAAEAYQRILSEASLATASWKLNRAAVRGEVEATRRIRQLLLDYGPSAYAAFESQALSELAALGSQPSIQDLERLARRFPASSAAATAWARVAEVHESAGQPRAAIASLREGLAAAETASAAGLGNSSEMLGELAGRLVSRLQRSEQYFAAAQTIARLQSRYPALVLTDRGGALDVASVSSDLTRRLASSQRLPRIGSAIQPQVQTIPHWSLMVAKSRDRAGTASEHVMMLAPSEGKVALWSIGTPRDAGEAPLGSTQLQMLWSRQYEQLPPTLLRQDPEAIYLFWARSPNNQGAVLERINAVDGSTVFRTDPFRGLFPANPALQRRSELLRNMLDTPLDGAVRLTDVLTAMDPDVIIMAERTGRIAAFERSSGKLLWAHRSPVSQVYDITIAGGILAVGGDAGPEADPDAISGLSPAIALHDARTGALLRRLDNLKGQVRWLRMGAGPNDQPALIAGLMSEIVSIDLQTGATSWTVTGGPAFSSLDAWVWGDRVFVLDQQRELWLFDGRAGRAPAESLPTQDRLTTAAAVEGMKLDDNRFAFATERGVCIFDAKGNLIGVDPLLDETADALLQTPVPSQTAFVTIEATPKQIAGNRVVYTMHILDSTSGMLRSSRHVQLEMPPKRLAVLDGRIVLTAGNVTLVYEAPEREEPRGRR